MGLSFALFRLALTMPAIIITGYLLEKLLAGQPQADVPQAEHL